LDKKNKKIVTIDSKQKVVAIHWNISKYIFPFLKNKKRAILTVISFWILFAFTITLVVLKVIKVDFMSSVDSNNVTVNLNYIP